MLPFFKHLFAKAETDLDGLTFKQQYLNDGADAVLLDVRTRDEFALGSIAGAKNIDFWANDFAAKIAALDKSKTYYLFCRSGNRSGKACNMMTSTGFKAYNLEGGIGAWPK
ncbi:rhodanese-like domain-containing protein [Sphingobacteriales bacterium UPWRP_1]|nr:rhodanese [Sphingobacteriales bacterium TSM_CSM]PSJ77830.1 rhodanese-like domain-containing protein [Sphingobacteriales bacterium UPWRP_1]